MNGISQYRPTFYSILYAFFFLKLDIFLFFLLLCTSFELSCSMKFAHLLNVCGSQLLDVFFPTFSRPFIVVSQNYKFEARTKPFATVGFHTIEVIYVAVFASHWLDYCTVK